ncbi:MAG: glycosyl hydrolase 53 family protein [Candidatus Thiodiazotropha sp.]
MLSRGQAHPGLFVLLSLYLFAGGCNNGGSTPNPPPPVDNSLFRVALSVSPFSELMFDAGLSLSDGQMTAGTVPELAQLFIRQGGNEVFARISTERTASAVGEDRSLARGVARAGLAASVALPLNPELGLFGSYGDHSCQTAPDFSEYPEITLPGPWQSLTVDQMIPALRSYGKLAAQEILAKGVRINIWDIGNEVSFGTAGVAPQPMTGSACDTLEGSSDWYRAPDGVDPAIGTESVASLHAMTSSDRIDWLETHLWPHQARLMAAVAEGILEADPAARFSTHITAALGSDFAVAFFQAMAKGGFLVDEIGFSFYPSSNAGPAEGRFEAFKAIVADVQTAFPATPVFVAEYAYPAEPISSGPYQTWNYEVPGYPISPQGQADLLKDLVSWCKLNGLSGIRPWAPDLYVGHWGPRSMFAATQLTQAGARPSLSAIQEALAQP